MGRKSDLIVLRERERERDRERERQREREGILKLPRAAQQMAKTNSVDAAIVRFLQFPTTFQSGRFDC